MVKSKKFWEHLCNKLDYRLFAGVPCLGLNPLYKVMNKDMLWYIPSANERIGLGIVSGGFLAGFKGGVLLSASALSVLKSEFQIVKDFNIPILLIIYSDVKMTYPFWHKELSDNFEKDLDKIASRNKPSILVIKEGILE
jgi:sulfopyruvate decarboxylase TPP-binding subunit